MCSCDCALCVFVIVCVSVRAWMRADAVFEEVRVGPVGKST